MLDDDELRRRAVSGADTIIHTAQDMIEAGRVAALVRIGDHVKRLADQQIPEVVDVERTMPVLTADQWEELVTAAERHMPVDDRFHFLAIQIGAVFETVSSERIDHITDIPF